jgi:hypothetical protein
MRLIILDGNYKVLDMADHVATFSIEHKPACYPKISLSYVPSVDMYNHTQSFLGRKSLVEKQLQTYMICMHEDTHLIWKSTFDQLYFYG